MPLQVKIPAALRRFRLPATGILASPIVRQGLYLAAGFLIAYVVLIGAGAYMLHNSRTQNSVTEFAEQLFPYPAAVVEGEWIPLSRFRTEVAARRYYAETHQITTTTEDTERFVMDQLVTRSLYAHALEKADITLDQASVDKELEDIYAQVGGQEKLRLFLQENYGPNVSMELFQLWLKEAAIENAAQNELLVRATLRHILVNVPDGASEAQIQAAHAKALTIRGLITPNLANFADIARDHSEDVASRDAGGAFGTTTRGDEAPVLSEEFETAAFTLPLHELSQPVRSPFGWHLVAVDERQGKEDLSKKAFTEKLRRESKVSLFVKLP